MSDALDYGVHNPFAMLDVFNCTDHCSVGGKNYAQYIAGLFLPLIEKPEHTDDDYVSALSNGINVVLS